MLKKILNGCILKKLRNENDILVSVKKKSPTAWALGDELCPDTSRVPI